MTKNRTYNEVATSIEYLNFDELLLLRKRLDVIISGRKEIADSLKKHVKRVKEKHGRK